MENNLIKNIFNSKLNSVSLKNSKQIDESTKNKFDALLKKVLNHSDSKEQRLNQNDKLNFSKHAIKRIHDRHIDLDSKEYIKLHNAMKKLKAKGSKESLVITDSGAYIFDVRKNRVVTAMDKGQLKENVFTKIDSTLFVN